MRISDWSSDVCSSCLRLRRDPLQGPARADPDLRAEGQAVQPDEHRLCAVRSRRRCVLHLPVLAGAQGAAEQERAGPHQHQLQRDVPGSGRRSGYADLFGILSVRTAAGSRSEEHTSELQSLMRISYAVFCLKKKNPHTAIMNMNKLVHTNIISTTSSLAN